MKANPADIDAAARALAQAHGFVVSDTVTAATGSRYFTVLKETPDGPAGFRVRISAHKAAGWQVRAHYALVTWHCVKRAKRDLARLERRLARLTSPNQTGGTPPVDTRPPA